MPEARCSCGQVFVADVGDTACPGCGAVLAVGDAGIDCACSACGAKFRVAPVMRGRLAKCPTCFQGVRVPAGAASKSAGPLWDPGRPRPTQVRHAPLEGASWRFQLRWLLALSMIPLLAYTIRPDDADQRLQKEVEARPDIVGTLDTPTLDDFLEAHPDHRIPGAFVRKGSWIHWFYAAFAAMCFWAFIMVAFPLGNATSRQLWLVGVFTGTIGVFLLLAVQFAAQFTGGYVVGRSILVIVFYILKFVAFSYNAANDPENGFVLSMFGFTFGVGLCEELCKILPVVWMVRRARLDLRGMIAWGLATGIGFGVSEGIIYSSDFYNGVSGAGIYVVRFISCVALHAVWSATSAVLLWRFQEDFHGADSWWEWLLPLLKVVGPSMAIHGLYDTLLKREMAGAALLCAIASFAAFHVLAAWTAREEDRGRAAAT